jgi:hypothetical protein
VTPPPASEAAQGIAAAPAPDPAAAATPAPAPESQSALARVAAATEQAVERVKQIATDKAPTRDALPAELAEDGKQLLESESTRERRAAADAILAYRPKERVPSHTRLIAEFETSRSCKARKQVIAKMQEAGDARFLPPLQRMARAPKSGCGFLSLGDCYSCVRRDLGRAITALEALD